MLEFDAAGPVGKSLLENWGGVGGLTSYINFLTVRRPTGMRLSGDNFDRLR